MIISEELCHDIMSEVLRKFSDGVLTDDDQDLLERYADALFSVESNYINPEAEIEDIIYGLVGRVYDYKLNFQLGYLPNVARETYPDKYQNDQKRKPKALQDAITKVIDLMGGDLYSTETGAELKKALKVARCNPADYIPNKPKPTPKNTEPIRKYLSSLKLGRPETINEFLSFL